jgi:pimeloyl-ACP methyl ester carboxylesterase
MGEYVQLGAVKTWYDEHSHGDPLVLLHGGMADAHWFEPNLEASGLSALTAWTLVMFGDDDLVTLTHMGGTCEAIPNAEFAIVRGTSHFLTQETPHL